MLLLSLTLRRAATIAAAALLLTVPLGAQTTDPERPVPPGPQAPAKPDTAAPRDPSTGSADPQAQPPDQKTDPDLEELRRRIELLAAELEQLRSGEEQRTTLTEAQRRSLGLGPSAASVYERDRGVSIAGYGEVLFENFDARNESGAGNPPVSRIDFLRAILYARYRFNDRFVFNSEIEVEHADEIFVEFAYIDFKVNDALTLRGGMLLLPMGLVNEFHEPNVFLGAKRPAVEQQIIPSTWRENGFGIVGSSGRFSYRAYLVNGLNASGFSAAGLRGGRQKGSNARVADWAFSGRLDFSPLPGTFFGGGLYSGESDQAQYPGVDLGTTIVEVHAQTQVRGFDLRGLFARATLDDVAAFNAARKLTGAAGVGERQQGGYAQIGYNVLSQTAWRTELMPYYRFEQLDTHAAVPAGFIDDPARDVRIHTLGIDVKPIGNVVVKADYQWIRNQARTGRNQFNVALGYAF